MGRDFWTAERIEILKSNWIERCADEIAEMIGDGCTKNMVIGKSDRLNLAPKDRSEAIRRVWARLTPDERKLWGRNIHASTVKNARPKSPRIMDISECKVAI